MLSSERKDQILRMLKQDHRVQAGELAARFGVSEDTIRRDLRSLADEGLIRRVYGGAVPQVPAIPHSPIAPTYAGRVQESAGAKAAIAKAAVRFIRPGQTVFFDAGTTAAAVAAHLPADLPLTAVTHSLPAASALLAKPRVEVVVLGGRVLRESAATGGAEVVNGYRRVRADLCVLGTASVHPEVGLAVFYHDDAEVKRAMVASAVEVMAVAAAEKFGTAAPFLVGPLSILRRLVTDAGAADGGAAEPAAEVVEAVRRAGIEIEVVRPG